MCTSKMTLVVNLEYCKSFRTSITSITNYTAVKNTEANSFNKVTQLYHRKL